MSFNYRVMRQKTPDGWWYGIFSMYYDPMGHSKTEASIVGESVHELRECLKKFERALEEPVLEWREGEGYHEVVDAGMLCQTRMQYEIHEPEDGWRKLDSFDAAEKAKLRPIAETLAMLDGNAFFGLENPDNHEHYEQYLPEACALYESNGGDKGWAGKASFVSDRVERL